MQPEKAVPEMQGHRLFAATYNLLSRAVDGPMMRPFRMLVAGSATGRVLEVGTGTGINFRYFALAESVVATDPDPFMLRRARKRARQLGSTVEFHQVPAEALPFPDGSFDTVVATLTLCSVRDPGRALAEIRRVLKPEGTFRFIEHVRADGGFHRRLQGALTPSWRRLGGGCHLNRDTGASIRDAGFETFEMIRQHMWLTPMIVGAARLSVAGAGQ